MAEIERIKKLIYKDIENKDSKHLVDLVKMFPNEIAQIILDFIPIPFRMMKDNDGTVIFAVPEHKAISDKHPDSAEEFMETVANFMQQGHVDYAMIYMRQQVNNPLFYVLVLDMIKHAMGMDNTNDPFDIDLTGGKPN